MAWFLVPEPNRGIPGIEPVVLFQQKTVITKTLNSSLLVAREHPM